MVTSRSCRSALIHLGLCLSLVPSLPTARGDVIAPWSGASARAGYNTQAGANASAQDQWSRMVEYSSLYQPGQGGYFVAAQGSSSANASGLADALLVAKAQATIGNPGTTGGMAVWGGDAIATANWMNDSVILTPPAAGGSMPDSVRLEFSVSFDKPIWTPFPDTVPSGQVDVEVNGMLHRVTRSSIFPPGAPDSFFDSVTNHLGRTLATFHLDLPLNAAGESGPFSLSLTATAAAVAPFSNMAGHSSEDATLSLDGLTLADGTSPASKGYGVSFASGLELQTVPEPTSVALWSVITLGGAWVARTRSRSRAAGKLESSPPPHRTE